MKGSVTGKVVEWELGETMDKLKDNLGAWDYVTFSSLLVFSCCIGFYFAWKDRNNTDNNNYALGGQTLSALPVALSLSATTLSAITMIGSPSEYYFYGITFAWAMMADVIACFVAIFVYVPIFYNLGITSIYEYLNLRFGLATRIIITVMFIIQSILYNSLVVYAPALAMNQVAGLDIDIGILVIGFVCILYTSLGGMKAVVWTDVFQIIWMMSGFLVIIIVTAIDFEGFKNVWNIALKGSRIEQHYEFDPRYRHTFWTVLIGSCTGSTMAGFNCQQHKVQRYLSCRSLKDARKCILYSIPVTTGVCIMAMLVGWCAYAYFEQCDPWSNKWINATDQIIPYLSLYMFASAAPGVAGIFMSAIFGASLSTTSSSINSCSVVIIEDILKPLFEINHSIIPVLSKCIMLAVGGIIIGFSYLAQNIGGILQACRSITGILGGSIMAIFSMGIFMPYITEIPAICGTFCGLMVSIWVYLGSNIFPPGERWTRPLPLDTASCTIATPQVDILEDNLAAVNNHMETSAGIYGLYHMSYCYLGTIGMLTSLLVAHGVALVQNKRATNKFFKTSRPQVEGTTWYNKITTRRSSKFFKVVFKDCNELISEL